MFGLIYDRKEIVMTCVFAGIVYILSEYRSIWRYGKIENILDEYSFSIYLSHTTVMMIFSTLQESVQFGTAKLAVLDLIGCNILIPLLHLLVEKPCTKLLKNSLRI